MTSQAEQPATPILLRKTYGWPGHTPDEAQIAACLPLAEAFTTECPDDHHFVAYAERAVNDVAVRLTTAALEPEHVQALDVPNVTMQLLVFDVDDPIAHDQKTAARPDWCEDERAKRERLALIAPGFASYNSKGGYRLIWRLEGVELTSPGDAEAWKDFYTGALAWLKEHSGIEGDPQCKDWTRLYRLPNVVRDGKPARSTIEGTLGEPWPLDRTIEPAKPARSVKVRSNRTEPHGGAPAVVEPLIAALADAVEPTWSDHNHNGWRFPFLGWLAGKGWSPAERAALLHELAERDETSAALRRKYANANDRAKSLDGPGDIVRETLGEAFGVVDRIVGRHPSAMANAYAVHREQRAEIGCVPGPQPFDAFKGSEQGDANEFAHFHADEVAWILEWARYIGWDGKRWSLSGGEMKARRAWQDLLAAKLETAAKIEDLEARKKLVDYVRSCMTRQRENNVLALAQSRLAVELARLDSDPWILNLENGILDLRTMQARGHDPATLCTRLAPVVWDENANCPRWLEFLDWAMCGNQELVGYLQRFFGLALTGDASHEVMHVFHGEGSNGKTTAVVTLEALLGGYAVRAPAKLLMAARVATGHNLIHLRRFHRGPLTRPVVLFDTSPLGSSAASAAVRGAGAARAEPGQPVPR